LHPAICGPGAGDSAFLSLAGGWWLIEVGGARRWGQLATSLLFSSYHLRAPEARIPTKHPSQLEHSSGQQVTLLGSYNCMRPDVDRRPFNLTPRHLHSTSQDKKKDSFENTLDSTATTSTSTVNTVASTSASTSTSTSQGSLRKRSLPRSNLEPDYQQEQQFGEKIDSDDPFAFTTTEPFPLNNNHQINSRSTNSSTMFSSRQKYSPLPNPNGTSSSGGKRRGGSSLSPLKKMIIVGGVVILLFIGLMGGKHVTRSTPAEEGGLEGYEEGEWAGGKGQYDVVSLRGEMR
jgi:hypothetical protein